ncbi:MAG: phosphoribosylformylglycinamidine synthase [Firmicutes bacterium]|nr:phosphoribosylformylglycinamidine synthase [Bacillota bacterium]
MSRYVKRIFVEKKKGFDVEAGHLFLDLKENLSLEGLENVRIINRYDISGISDSEYKRAVKTIFSEPNVDNVYEEEIEINNKDKAFAIEFLPGQYDQRADSAAQCVEILTENEIPIVRTAKLFILEGQISEEEFNQVKKYCINPVDSREASLEKPKSLDIQYEVPKDVSILSGFMGKDESELKVFKEAMGFAMSLEDLKFCQEYFKNDEKRDPFITELKVIDTYWSDHCRHTTFLTKIEEAKFSDGEYGRAIKNVYNNYLNTRKYVYGEKEKDICLMDIAVIGMKELRKKGLLDDLDVSEEINACSINVPVEIDGKKEEWLVMFKNETHNHPTEIEPFGGAATCLGGAIRDPLSGRSYVYQAMRVTGSGDPRAKIEDTLNGKLPQRKITREAAQGFSSYGNQIGLATGQVSEFYDEGYVAKRMEIGAVIAATPKENVIRERPKAGDLVILVGGRTGRDGCGGATGSSKEHTEDSILDCGAEVQKGNPPVERKLQRLFRNPRFSKLVKRCNDFGAGGVSVAIGELADSLEINLDNVPKKYDGLDGTELAISESQERMAIVIDKESMEIIQECASEENLETSVVAKVTSDNRLRMKWRGNIVLDISRDFLDTNGVKQNTKVFVKEPIKEKNYFNRIPTEVEKSLSDIDKAWIENLKDLNVACQKGLGERFDSTIGAGTVLMPFGGKYQLTPAQSMVGKIPVLKGETDTCTIMTHGFDPKLSKWSPFHGALYAVLESLARVVVAGGNHKNVRLTLQEYFEKLGNDEERWGKPFSALLGAYHAQKSFGIPAIGGKDSMSGTFNDLDVPPTLVSFAVDAADAKEIISPEFKKANSKIILIKGKRDKNELPDFQIMNNNFTRIHQLILQDKILAAHTVGIGGVAAATSKMAFGNKIGITFKDDIDSRELFIADYGSIIVEIDSNEDIDNLLNGINYVVLGTTKDEETIEILGSKISLDTLIEAWQEPLKDVFPIKEGIDGNTSVVQYTKGNKIKAKGKFAKPRVVIPVFPGTNCEYDTGRAFVRAGGEVNTLIFKNLKPTDIKESIEMMAKTINESQIIALPGGFSAGDEPDGSGKFIATIFRNPIIEEAIMNLLRNRDGLMIGICNGFQALVKLGLLPYGEIREMDEHSPTLTFNKLGRHISRFARTKLVSNLSPWFNGINVGDIHNIALSHGEGRFVANEDEINRMIENGQVATQYVDINGELSYDGDINPNGSINCIEGITSPDGRILGKMGHSERIGKNLYKNILGEKDQRIFEAGVKYFRD